MALKPASIVSYEERKELYLKSEEAKGKRFCPACGVVAEAAHLFCSACSLELPKRFSCESCGTLQRVHKHLVGRKRCESQALHCTACGGELRKATQAGAEAEI
jgi:hypothetical protein